MLVPPSSGGSALPLDWPLAPSPSSSSPLALGSSETGLSVQATAVSSAAHTSSLAIDDRITTRKSVA
jgi:hypothetical protein